MNNNAPIFKIIGNKLQPRGRLSLFSFVLFFHQACVSRANYQRCYCIIRPNKLTPQKIATF